MKGYEEVKNTVSPFKQPKVIKAIDVMQLLKDLNDNAPDEFNAKVNSIILNQKQYDLHLFE